MEGTRDVTVLPLSGLAPYGDQDSAAPDISTASDEYARRFAGAIGAYLLHRQETVVRSLLGRLGTGSLRVLEVGGGHLQLTGLFAELGHDVVVHGSARSCFSRMEGVQRRFPGRVSPLLGPLVPLPAEDRSFDLVCSVRLLAHVPIWRELLAEKCRVSRRYVLCEFTVKQGVQRLSAALLPIKKSLEVGTRPFTTIKLSEMTSELARHGFAVVGVERQFVLPMVMHRTLKSPAMSRFSEGMLLRVGLTSRVGSPAVLLAERTER